jgi:hypothetical protein
MARKGHSRVVENLQFPNPSTSPVRHDDLTLHPHLSSIAKRFKVPFFELMKVWAAASKQFLVSQLYSPVKLLYVLSPSILSSQSVICLSPVRSPTLFRLLEFPAVPTIYTAQSRASERHNLDLYPSCSSSPSSVSLCILAQPNIYCTERPSSSLTVVSAN